MTSLTAPPEPRGPAHFDSLSAISALTPVSTHHFASFSLYYDNAAEMLKAMHRIPS